MRFVVDTNILFSFFWDRSATREILLCPNIELYAPEYALEEIKTHKMEIIRKNRITERRFSELCHDLAIAVEFIPIEMYRAALRDAATFSPDPNDADFFALALHLELPLWSNDTRLKQQRRITVVNTTDLIGNPEFNDAVFPFS